jgi:transposase-like protein
MTSTIDSVGAVIRSDRRGRMLVSPAQREALLDEFERSGVSAMAFCKRHGLVYPTFASWVQKRRQRPAPGAPAFAEVVVEPRREKTPAAGGNAALRITLPGGALIEMTGHDQLPLVVELLRALGLRLPC